MTMLKASRSASTGRNSSIRSSASPARPGLYVIPFTSIVEQTAAVFREALATEDDVLEHHGSYDWDAAAQARRDDGEGPDGLAKLRRDTENWAAPIVVTTSLQFFESLFAARTSRAR